MTDLSFLGARSAGVWTRRDALALVTPGQLRAFLRDGSWQTVLPSVYADAGCVLAPEQRGWAVVLSRGGPHEAVAFGRTAARVWGLPLIDDDDPATGAAEGELEDVAVRRPRRRTASRVTAHQRRLDAADVVRRPSGLPVTTVARTLFDCASLLSADALVCAMDNALHRGLTSPAELSATAERLRWQPGAPACRTAMRLADGRSESPAETLTRLLLLPVLPDLEPQVEVFDHAMRPVARFDLADRRVRLAVEADGTRGHAGREMVAKDRRRDRRTEHLGWWTERVTWWDVRRDQAATRQRIVERHRWLASRTDLPA